MRGGQTCTPPFRVDDEHAGWDDHDVIEVRRRTRDRPVMQRIPANSLGDLCEGRSEAFLADGTDAPFGALGVVGVQRQDHTAEIAVASADLFLAAVTPVEMLGTRGCASGAGVDEAGHATTRDAAPRPTGPDSERTTSERESHTASTTSTWTPRRPPGRRRLRALR